MPGYKEKRQARNEKSRARGYQSPEKHMEMRDNSQPPRVKRMVDDIVERGKPELQSKGDTAVPNSGNESMREYGSAPNAVPYKKKNKKEYRI